jgi:uncharacterized delta-60 repeat protein
VLVATGRALAHDGVLDPTFGRGGLVVTEVGERSAACGVVSLVDGGLLIAASITEQQDAEFALLRYDRNGALDPAFGVGGIARTRFVEPAEAQTMAVQADGKIVVAGSLTTPGGGTRFGLARFDEHGRLDPTFGDGGMVATRIGDLVGPQTVLPLPDGKLLASSAYTLARFESSGALDPTFGNGGALETVTFSWMRSLTRQADGLLLAAGIAPGFTGAVCRMRPDGALDEQFGSGGFAVAGFGLQTNGLALSLRPNGALLMVGPIRSEPDSMTFGLARFHNDGTGDDGFGDGGMVSTRFARAFSIPFAVAVQPDEKIVAAGYATASLIPSDLAPSDFALARYLPDGRLDPSFGDGGRVQTDFSPLGPAQALAMTLTSDDEIVAVGTVGGYLAPRIALARYARRIDGETCAPQPLRGCRQALRPRDTTLMLGAGIRNELAWRWRRGEDTAVDAFGDPRTGTAYAFCLYDESATTAPVVLEAALPPAALCRQRPCWRSLAGSGFVYRDQHGSTAGITRVDLSARVNERAALTVRGQGPRLVLPQLPLTLPLRVQLQTDGQCWESLHSVAGALRNDPQRFRGFAE